MGVLGPSFIGRRKKGEKDALGHAMYLGEEGRLILMAWSGKASMRKKHLIGNLKEARKLDRCLGEKHWRLKEQHTQRP